MREVARDLVCIGIDISNCYLVGKKKSWSLVDAGTGGHADDILKVVRKRFGKKAKPEAIILTHGHFDHAGSASELADHWGVTVLAHSMEMPFVDGRSAYPPPDPTVGGFMSFVIRFIPSRNNKVDLGNRVQELESLRKLPGMKDWEAIETPGHTPGHLSFWRKNDRVLIAGDAFTTVNQDSFFDMMGKKQKVCRPPVYYTCDWDAAHESVKRLSRLKPEVLAAGHGVPMSGTRATRELEDLARYWPAPERGRYVPEAAEADENGIVYLPPPAPDAVPKVAAGLGAATAVAGVAAVLVMQRRGHARSIAQRAGIVQSEVA